MGWRAFLLQTMGGRWRLLALSLPLSLAGVGACSGETTPGPCINPQPDLPFCGAPRPTAPDKGQAGSTGSNGDSGGPVPGAPVVTTGGTANGGIDLGPSGGFSSGGSSNTAGGSGGVAGGGSGGALPTDAAGSGGAAAMPGGAGGAESDGGAASDADAGAVTGGTGGSGTPINH